MHFASATAAVGFFGATWAKAHVLAQVPVIDPTIGNLIGNFGIMGVLVWYLYYNTTSSYPKMMEKFAAEQKADRDLYAEEQKAAREAFASQMESTREHHTKELNELRTMLYKMMEAMRTAVHDVRDTAQVAINKAAVLDAKKREGG